MKKRICTLLTSGLILAATAASLSACGAGSSKSVANGAMAETTAAAMEAMPGGAPESYRSAQQAPGAVYAETEAAVFDTAAEAGAGDGGLTSGTAIQPVNSSRKLIRTVNLDVETTEFDSLLATLTQTVASMGGYIEQSDISGNSISDSQGSRRYAWLTARVPSNKLDSFVSQVDENGNITNKSENTQDVTLQYSDIESRKKTLAVEQDRLWDLLAKADSMDAVIALESRLSEIRYQLESMESQLRTFDNQVDYSSVYLSINEVKVFTPTAPDSVMTRIQKGFSRNLEGVGNSAVNFFVWFVSSLPVLLVFAVIVAAVTFLLNRISRKALKKRGKSAVKPQLPPMKAQTSADKKEDAQQQDQQ